MSPKTKKTILFIEDEAEIRNIYGAKFRKAGYKVITADSGAKGVELALRKNPDLIFLDLVLPIREGFVVLEELKKNSKTKSIPVVILSNLDQDYEIKMAKNLGAEAYLTKTDTTPDVAVKIVKKILNNKNK